MGASWFAEMPRVAACRACGYPTLGVNYCAVCANDVLAAATHPGLDAHTDPGFTPAA
ncbi:hypothetical protein MLIT_13660 [Mycolicibacterium litorale]|uniref:Uncharacterized protein n=1 Tax=Mycolicibacterium litorale TaxID=758802 RepID=A0AAD1IHX8_9MYCO|nr:hypothetical protein BCL50_5250 [Mycolicibacterium litorale]BBY15774.1 hypothetical protein MLIT_13660 [Mycolicibacterium litorale]